MKSEPLIHEHCGYKELKSFQIARLVYDVTVRFCNRYIDKHSRTHNQMVQTARSGVQNIAEGSKASATSIKTELKLTSVAQTSLEELRLDYEDFLRQNNMTVWPHDDRRRKILTRRQCSTVAEIALWVLQEHKRQSNRQLPSTPFIHSITSIPSSLPEITANAVLTLIILACRHLDQQIDTLVQGFETESGLTESLYCVCTAECANN